MVKCSIMGYSTSDYTRIIDNQGHAGSSFDFLYNDSHIASVKYYGLDADIEIDWVADCTHNLCSDFSDLLLYAKSIGHNTDLLDSFVVSDTESCRGFILLLSDLDLFIGHINNEKVYAARNGYSFFGAAMFGRSLINKVSDYPQSFLGCSVSGDNEGVALNSFMQVLRDNNPEIFGTIQAVAFLSGDFNWEFTKEGFFDLFDIHALD